MNDQRKQVHADLAENKIIPVCGTAPLHGKEDAVALAEALYKGGSKVIEFVLRSGNARDIVNRDVFDAIREKCKGMRIGIGTCVTAENIEMANEAGADFTVAATLRWECVEKANELGLFHLPGVGSLERFSNLITGDEVSPVSGKTAHDLLGGDGVATLKVHPDGSTDLIDVINATLLNEFQKKEGIVKSFGLEPSELVEKNWGLKDIAHFAKKDNVTMLGGTFPYVLPDGKGGWRNLIADKNWKGITELTQCAMDLTHGRTPTPLSDDMRLAGGDSVSQRLRPPKMIIGGPGFKS